MYQRIQQLLVLRRLHADHKANWLWRFWQNVAYDRMKELSELHNDAAKEKQRRIYYQNIIYEICNKLDEVYTPKTVCGTIDCPSTETQARVAHIVAMYKLQNFTED
jgi:hypothetical protein